MTAIGKRVLDLMVTTDVRFHDGQFAYLSSRSTLTRPDDTVATNRQYLGLLLQGPNLDYSWVSGDRLGGRSQRTHGTAKFINPDGIYSLDYIQEQGLSVERQPFTYRIGELGDDLGDMIELGLEGRQIRPSEDSFEVHVDISDKGQALDTSILLDRFQGLGGAVRCLPGYYIRVPYSASLQPASAFYVTINYRLPSWYATGVSAPLIYALSNAAGYVWSIALQADGTVAAISQTSGGSPVTLLATDLDWIADGRWHQVALKWSGTTLSLFHTTRTTAVKSAITAAQTTIATLDSGEDLYAGDPAGLLGTHEWLDIGQIAVALDGDVPSDAEILSRLKRTLTEDEGDECEMWLALNEYTGTTANDESPATTTAGSTTTPTSWSSPGCLRSRDRSSSPVRRSRSPSATPGRMRRSPGRIRRAVRVSSTPAASREPSPSTRAQRSGSMSRGPSSCSAV